MAIRAAHPQDAASIATIWNEVIRTTAITFNPTEKTISEVEHMIREREAAGYATLVLEDEGQFLGFATYSQFRGGLGYARAMEHTIYLAPDARGKRLAGPLLEALLDHAKAGGKRIMVGAITAENEASLRLHARYGFFEAGRLPDAGWKFDRYHELVFMQKLLD